jgi:hypothetical protein
MKWYRPPHGKKVTFCFKNLGLGWRWRHDGGLPLLIFQLQNLKRIRILLKNWVLCKKGLFFFRKWVRILFKNWVLRKKGLFFFRKWVRILFNNWVFSLAGENKVFFEEKNVHFFAKRRGNFKYFQKVAFRSDATMADHNFWFFSKIYNFQILLGKFAFSTSSFLSKSWCKIDFW